MNDRNLQIMKTLVEQYLREGQPVSSKYLAHSKAITASPATVRNVMMNLEKMGLLHSPHTSAGRVPTVTGLRLFVDQLLTIKPLEQHIQQSLQAQLDKNMSPSQLCQHASNLLSEMTALTGIVSVPKQNQTKIERIEFIKLSSTRLIAVLVMHDGEVQNRIIETQQAISDVTLQQTTQVMNAAMAGQTLDEGMARVKQLSSQINQEVAELSSVALSFSGAENDADGLVLTGQSRLLDSGISPELDKIRALFEAVSEKQLLVDIMERCSGAEGVKVFIGEESGIDLLEDCSVISAPYQSHGEVVGRLAVIGSTRLNYKKVIPIVDITARMLTSALNQVE